MKTSGPRRLAAVAALAAGVVLALAAMPGCGSGCPTPEERAYLDAVVDWTERTLAAREDLRTITAEGASRPEVLIDDEWRRRLKGVLDELTSGHEAVVNVEVPPRADEVHRVLVRAADAFIEANELFWRGVLDLDVASIQRGGDKLVEGGLLVNEATTMAEDFCE